MNGGAREERASDFTTQQLHVSMLRTDDRVEHYMSRYILVAFTCRLFPLPKVPYGHLIEAGNKRWRDRVSDGPLVGSLAFCPSDGWGFLEASFLIESSK